MKIAPPLIAVLFALLLCSHTVAQESRGTGGTTSMTTEDIDRHWTAVKTYRNLMRHPPTAEPDQPGQPSGALPDIRLSLAALESAGELEHVDLVLPKVPRSREAIRYWMKWMQSQDKVWHGLANPQYAQFRPKGDAPLHLLMWYEPEAAQAIQRLIRDLESIAETGAPLANNPQDQAGEVDPAKQGMTAKQIIKRMAESYANCETYRDTGLVSTFIGDAGNNNVLRLLSKTSFKTAYVRPDKFRFSFTSHDQILGGRLDRQFIIWRDGEDLRQWWSIKPEVKKPDSLEMAIAGGTGISGGSAHTIPRLLMPDEVSGNSLTTITKLKRADDVMLGDVRCFAIDGKYADSPIHLLIEQDSFLLRQIADMHELDGKTFQSTTSYTPVINKPVPDEALAFDIPAAEQPDDKENGDKDN